jgi:hypothetical protein
MMTDIFEKYIHEKVNVTDEEYKIIRDAFVPKKLKRKQYLLQEGM